MRQFAMAAMIVLGMSVGLCRAETLASKELINNAKAYDGKVVAYRGEAVGATMVRGDHAWINLNDGVNALGIWVTKEIAAGVTAGTYRARGDALEITGIFHRACPEHGGDLDIHAESATIVEKGSPILHPVNNTTIKLSALFFIALLLFIFWRPSSTPAQPSK
jgi:hypothetical protein